MSITDVRLNEVVGSTTSADVEFIELFGPAGTSLLGLSLIIVESDAGASLGTIDRRLDFTDEHVIGGNGFFLVGNASVLDAYGVAPDLIVADNYIENSSYTLALVETASLSGGVVAGTEVAIDSVGVTDGGVGDTFFFGAPVVGPDGTFLPAGARRIADGVDTDAAADWAISDFNNDPTVNTPTAAADLPTPTQPTVINELVGSTTSADVEFIEIFGAAGASLEGLSLVIVESDAGASLGTIDRRLDFTAEHALGENGFFLVGNASVADTYGVTPDLIVADNYVENSSYTAALVETASLSGGVVAGTEVAIDSVGVTDGGADDSFFFGAPVIGPDGTFLPAGVRRLADGVDTDAAADWALSDFNNDPTVNTPTAAGGGDGGVQPTVINEVLVSTTSTDVEFIEIFGEPGASLAGLSVLNIESDDATGNIDNRFDLPDDAAIGENGFYLIGNSLVASTLGVTPNAILPANFFENSSSTIALVETATISGTSVTGAETAIDALALTDDGAGAFYYGAPVLGPDGTFYPSAAGRFPDGGAFQLIDAFSPAGANTTPTAGTFDTSFAERKIHEIQGSTDLADGTLVGVAGAADQSPLLGQGVRVQGVVTQIVAGLGGFYLQEEDADADADAASSEGIFVASPISVALGDIVTVDGTVQEVEGETRIAAANVAIDDAGDNSALVTPTEIAFPTATVLQDADGDYVANLEAYEGMLVTIPEAMSVTELFQLDRFGAIRISSDGRLEQYTQANAPSAAGYEQHLKDVAARSLVIDDGSDAQNPSEILVPDLGADGRLDGGDVFRMGDAYTNLTGVLGFSEDDQSSSEEPEYRLHTPSGELTQTNERDAAPEDVGGDFRVASANVLNFFTTLDTFPGNEGVGPNDLEPRGADTNPQEALPGVGELDEYERQLQKLVEGLTALEADVIGLVEIENDFLLGGESPNDADAQGDRGVAVQALVDAINAYLGDEIYDWVNPGAEFVGGDAIAVGFIYDATTVRLVGEAAVLEEFEGQSFLDPNNTGEGKNRAALAQTFEEIETGGQFTAAINHLKSKGDSGLAGADPATNPDVDQGDGQGYWNDTRTQAAGILADWLASDPTGSGDLDTLILGDLNAYAHEDPITLLESVGYTDLAEAFIGASAYSYVFDGQLGTLDYALANESLTAQVTGVAEWHVNADEADAFDYNLEFGRDPDLFTLDPYRYSDHDPVLIGLNLTPSNTAPVAADDAAATAYDAVATIDVLTNDVDAEGDPLSVTALEGAAVAAGESVILASGAIATLNADQSVSYDPNGRFAYLAGGESASDGFGYAVSDGEAADDALVFVTVEGSDDLHNTGDRFYFAQLTNGGANLFGFNGDDFIITGLGVRGRPTFNDVDDFLKKSAEVFDGVVEASGEIDDQRLPTGDGPDAIAVDGAAVTIGGAGIEGAYLIRFDDQGDAENFKDFVEKTFRLIDENDVVASDPEDFRFDIGSARVFFDKTAKEFGLTTDGGATQQRFGDLETFVEGIAAALGGEQLRDGAFDDVRIADGRTPLARVVGGDDVRISGLGVSGRFEFDFVDMATAQAFEDGMDALFKAIDEADAVGADLLLV